MSALRLLYFYNCFSIFESSFFDKCGSRTNGMLPHPFPHAVEFKVRSLLFYSNTRPAGRMWPARCVCAARDIINIIQIIAETTVFCSINALLASYCGLRRHFFSCMRPASPFLVKCGPRMKLSLRPLL